MGYEQGTLDVMQLTSEYVEQYKDDPGYNPLLVSTVWWMQPNCQVAPFDSMEARLAFAYAVDKEAICQNILRDNFRDLAEDAIAETFICLWQEVKNGKKIQNTLQGYIYGIARNQALQILRKNRQDRESAHLEGIEGIENILVAADMEIETIFAKHRIEQAVHQAVNKMAEPDRTIFLLRYFYFYKIKEIARKTQLNEDAVESRLRRGKKKLEKYLKKRGVFYEENERR